MTEQADKEVYSYRNNWIKENKERVNLVLDKGEKEKIKAIAKSQGMSLNAFIVSAINEKISRL